MLDVFQLLQYQLLFRAFLAISGIIYFLQKYVLLLVLFSRVFYIFNGTGLSLSKLTFNIFIILFTITPILLVLSVILAPYFSGTIIYILVVAIFIILLNVGFIISLVLLLLYKLYAVYKLMTHQLEKYQLISVISKTTLLATFNIIFSVLGPISIIIAVSSSHTKTQFYSYIISGFTIPFEIILNLICITLSFRYFNNIYKHICKFCDHCFKITWYKMLNSDIPEIKRIEQAQTSMDSPRFVAQASNGLILINTPITSSAKTPITPITPMTLTGDTSTIVTTTTTDTNTMCQYPSTRVSAILHPYLTSNTNQDPICINADIVDKDRDINNNDDDDDDGFVIIADDNDNDNQKICNEDDFVIYKDDEEMKDDQDGNK